MNTNTENLQREVEQLRVQLAGCFVAAEGGISNPAQSGDYGWSPAYQAVVELRRNFEALSEEQNG